MRPWLSGDREQCRQSGPRQGRFSLTVPGKSLTMPHPPARVKREFDMETGGISDVPGDRLCASPFAAQMLRFAGLLQRHVAPADHREAHDDIGVDVVQALPCVATAAEFLLLRSILVEFASRTLTASGLRADAGTQPGSGAAGLRSRRFVRQMRRLGRRSGRGTGGYGRPPREGGECTDCRTLL